MGWNILVASRSDQLCTSGTNDQFTAVFGRLPLYVAYATGVATIRYCTRIRQLMRHFVCWQPFPLDYREVLLSLCDILTLIYSKLVENVSASEDVNLFQFIIRFDDRIKVRYTT